MSNPTIAFKLSTALTIFVISIAGRVLINGSVAKPSANVKVGDKITIQFGNKDVNVEVLAVEEIVISTSLSLVSSIGFGRPEKKAIHIYDIPASDVITKDKKTMSADSFALWRIDDPQLFIQTLNGSVGNAEARIETLTYNAMKNVISSRTQTGVITGRDGQLAHDITAAVVDSGTDGNITWSLDSNGKLTISGTGAMKDYSSKSYSGTYATSAPWGKYYKDIKSVVIESGITSIGNFAFDNCSSLTSVTIPDSVTSIGNYAFNDCYGLTSVTIPDSVQSIGDSAFSWCSSLTSVTIGSGVTSIGNYAFYGCSSLTSVTIPDSVQSIGDNAFYDCDSLTSVYITDLAAWCGISFSNSSSNPLCYADDLYLNGELVTDLVIPDSVQSIGYSAFRGCSSLKSVTIPDSMISIGDAAFLDCWNLMSMTIPASVTSIGNRAFSCCSGISGISVASNNKNYSSKDGVLFNYDKTKLIQYPAGKHEVSYTIPSGVTSVAEYAFEGNWTLTSITIPNSMTSIGDYAFFFCDGITSMTIPNNITSIGDGAFTNCHRLERITIPNSVKSIGKEAFMYCDGLTSIAIPSSVKSINEDTFFYCTALTNISIPEGVKSIETCAFEGCSSLKSVKIPDSVTSIGDGIFALCSNFPLGVSNHMRDDLAVISCTKGSLLVGWQLA